MTGLRQRPGDQPLPTSGTGPGMHDLVIADIHAHGDPDSDAVAALLASRRQIGLDRYGSLLWPGNGRDVLRDLAEELADAIVYARQATLEGYGAAQLEEILVAAAASVLEIAAHRDAGATS